MRKSILRRKRGEKKKGVYTRVVWIDFLRAVAILLMIATHTVVVFYNYEKTSIFDSTLENISLFGGVASFTLFLFISGATMYHVLIKKEEEEINGKKYVIRSVKLTVIFYLLSIFLNYAFNLIFLNKNLESLSKDLIDILIFNKLPPLAEFLIPFIILPLVIVLFIKPVQSLVKTRIGLPIIGILLFILGTYLSRIHLSNDIFLGVKSIFFGSGPEVHSFPIFQYSIVFLLGISFAYEYQNIKRLSKKIIFNACLSLIGIFTVFISYYIFENQYDIQSVNISWYTGRFPPSIPFLMYGLIFGFLVLIGLDTYRVLARKHRYLRFAGLMSVDRTLLYIGSRALPFYLIHVLVLAVPLILENRFNSIITSDSTLRTVVLYIFLISFIYLVTKLIDTARIGGYIQTTQRIIAGLAPFFIGVSVVGSIFLLASYYVGVQPEANAMNLDRIIKFSTAEMWWDDSYASRAEIDLGESTSGKYLIEIDIAEIPTYDINLNDNLNNFRVVDQSLDEPIELPTLIEVSSERISIYFESNIEQNNIYVYSDSNYEPSKLKKLEKSGNYEKVNIENFVAKSVKINLQNDWYLKSWSSEEASVVDINTILFYQDVLSAEVEVIGTDIRKDISVTDSAQSIKFPELENLEPGRYGIQAKYTVFENSIRVYTSNIFYINISYPLFVNWSIDWEGYGVGQGDLDDIADIANKYGVQITHYFNPRIYIPNQYSFNTIGSGSAQYITNWVLNRKRQAGDEIGLHVHMFEDFEEEIENHYFPDVSTETSENEEGEPIEEPVVVETSSGNNSIDAEPGSQIQGLSRNENKLQGYPYEDLVLIFEWSVNKFKENGLGTPLSFRSGAWMSGPNVLKALQDNGIKIDSTGRTGGLLNPNVASSSPIPWDLSVTQKPYFPNVNNINSSSSPNLSLLEVPNNGADSYWFSVDEMVNRFQANYEAYANDLGHMKEPQIVTYLSHPHGFSIYDSQKIREMLDQVTKFTYAKGDGPVVLTTLENIYNNFDISLF